MSTNSVLDTIGNTPLIPLRRMVAPGMAAVLMKMEAWNPSGSLKDRIVKYIIEEAEKAGVLKPHHIIIDASSGNTGIALGMVATLKGYRSRIYMPETKSIERRKIMKTWGTELVLTSGADQNSHIWEAQKAAKDTDTFFYLDQNGNEGNVLSHYHGTGAEIWQQTRGRLDCFVAGAGTGGTLMGVARYLRDKGCPGEHRRRRARQPALQDRGAAALRRQLRARHLGSVAHLGAEARQRRGCFRDCPAPGAGGGALLRPFHRRNPLRCPRKGA